MYITGSWGLRLVEPVLCAEQLAVSGGAAPEQGRDHPPRPDHSLNGGIRSTFEGVPDAPVTKFILEMQGGKKGLIVNSVNICKHKHRALANFKGQNGRRHEFKPVVKAQCGGKKG